MSPMTLAGHYPGHPKKASERVQENHAMPDGCICSGISHADVPVISQH